MSDLVPAPEESFILCLDDDQEFLDSLEISLTGKFGHESRYNFLFLNDPVEALEVVADLSAEGEDLALILTDQMMPNIKGVDFLRQTKKTFPDTMRVLLTGYAGLDSAVEAINENILHRYLTKPIADINDLFFTLTSLLNEYHLQGTVGAQQRIILDLYNFSNTLNSSNCLKQILDHTVSFTKEALNCERISILMLENGELRIKAGSGISPDIIKKIRIPLGENIAGKVLREKEAMLVKDINQLKWLKTKINQEFDSFISAPVICADLMSSNIPIGVINVTNKRDNQQFTEHDLRTISFIANSASIAIHNQQNRISLEKNYLETIKALIVTLEARDDYTKGHSVRVTEYSVGIAEVLKLDEETIDNIKNAAILHDIGKIGVRDDVLFKPGSLNEGELFEIQKHPDISMDILNSIGSFKKIAPIVRQHHEKYDGTGYPEGLKGEEILLEARILSVADTYDAMTSKRPYREILDKDFVIQELKRYSGLQFDPQCVEAFFEYIERQDVQQ